LTEKENMPVRANQLANLVPVGSHRKRLMSANRVGSHRNIFNAPNS
jgi:hypothetical protein